MTSLTNARYDLLIMTDGSCGAKEDQGAWAAVVTDGIIAEVVHGTEYPSTNIRCELLAIAGGIRWAAKRHTEPKDAVYTDAQPLRVLLLTDSEYAVDTYTQGLDVKSNRDLWLAIRRRPYGMALTMTWVPRNSTGGNAYCDALAGALRAAAIDTGDRLVRGYTGNQELGFRGIAQTLPMGELRADFTKHVYE